MAMQTLPVTASPAEAIVFDFGGVLFNWQPPKLIQQVWPHHARTDDEALALAQEVFQSFVPGCDWSEFDRGVLSRDETLRRIAARTGLPLADLDALVSAIPPHLAPVQPTVAWLERLAAAGVRLHFLSNMPRPYADFLEAQHPFLRHFRSGVFSCDVHEVKPGDSMPNRLTSPRVGRSDRNKSRSSEVLPAPEGPVRNWNECAGISKLRSRRISGPSP